MAPRVGGMRFWWEVSLVAAGGGWLGVCRLCGVCGGGDQLTLSGLLQPIWVSTRCSWCLDVGMEILGKSLGQDPVAWLVGRVNGYLPDVNRWLDAMMTVELKRGSECPRREQVSYRILESCGWLGWRVLV
jgi:hypothetical protein